jgi:hypothetical protein
MKKITLCAMVVLTSAVASLPAYGENPYIGYWVLTLPNGGPGWLGITQEKGDLDASILWGGGSEKPVNSIKVEDDGLVIMRVDVPRRGTGNGKRITETITATLSGDDMRLATVKARPDGREFGRAEFTGKRTPPLPPRPDLSKVKFGASITLFNGTNLDGWGLTDPGKANGWIVESGVLVNRPTQPKGKQHVSYGNLRTIDEFEDCKLKFEVTVPERSNSGVYLGGIYELQVFDSYGKPPSPHNMGVIFSRITPAVSAEKPAEQWQTFEVTLLDRHVTVVLNGKTIIDNKPLLGCTGGALCWTH